MITNLVNHYKTVKDDLVCAEKTRRIQILKNCIKFLIPFFPKIFVEIFPCILPTLETIFPFEDKYVKLQTK